MAVAGLFSTTLKRSTLVRLLGELDTIFELDAFIGNGFVLVVLGVLASEFSLMAAILADLAAFDRGRGEAAGTGEKTVRRGGPLS